MTQASICIFRLYLFPSFSRVSKPFIPLMVNPTAQQPPSQNPKQPKLTIYSLSLIFSLCFVHFFGNYRGNAKQYATFIPPWDVYFLGEATESRLYSLKMSSEISLETLFHFISPSLSKPQRVVAPGRIRHALIACTSWHPIETRHKLSTPLEKSQASTEGV